VPGTEPFLIFPRKLRDLGLPHMVSGSVAAIYYGEPRLTNDVDIIVSLRASDVPRIEAAFPLREFYCPPRETILTELGRERRGHFNLIHHATGFKADLYLAGTDPLHAWALARVRKVNYEGEELALAPPEYVILRKLQFFREGGSAKHLRDIRRMLTGLGTSWDRSALEGRVEDLGVQAEWARAQEPETA
jgi:hypothetical protein